MYFYSVTKVTTKLSAVLLNMLFYLHL